MIKIRVDLKPALDRLKELRERGAKTKPLMRVVSGIMKHAVDENFRAGGRPAWRPSARAKAEGGQTLIKTGLLAGTIIEYHDDKSAIVGTNIKYAAIHQFGGRTAAHVIRPGNKKALFWPGAPHPFASVNHPGSRIPARPFLMLTDADKQDIVDAAKVYLKEGL